MTYQNEKAVIYARVSSKGQEENGFSLDAQEKLALEYSAKQGLQVVKIWKGAESAWGKIERQNFSAMLAYVKKHREVRHIVFDVLDRMTRNDIDKIRIAELIQDYGKIIHFSRDNKVYSKASSPDDFFMLDVQVCFAKKLSNDISRKTTMGMTEKAEQGIYPSRAPIGYLNNHRSGKIDVDPERAPFIKKLFELAASGEYSLQMIEDILYKEGLRERLHGGRVRKNTLYRVLHNPMYYGEFFWAKKLYPGTHLPIISKDLYERAHKALSQFQRPRVTTCNYPFSNLLHCKTCGCSVVGDFAKKKYMYYRCSFAKGQHPHEKYIREHLLDEAFAEMIDGVSITPDIAKWFQKAVDLRLKYVEKAQNKEIAGLKAELSKTEAKLERLYNEGLDGKYSPEFINYNEKRCKSRIAELAQQIQNHQINPESVRQKSIDILKLVCNMGTIYRAAPLAEKKPLLRHIASDYILDGHKIYPKYREPFNIFAEGNKKCLEIKGKIPKSSKHLIWGG
ncbi:MAG: recombinase family protein [Candidatus Avelusimicrobium sp.]|uniref:recombinase family protein n=1 Tax=Candidatus Avelusimicrobium sp. TaxID=3048833 RepID=UPI003F0BA98E